jgi:hypothetical protein
MARKRLWHIDNDGGDDDSSDSSNSPEEEPKEEEEETEAEVSSKEMLMRQINTSEEKLYARHAHGYLFSDNGDTPSMSPDTPPTLEIRRCSDEGSSNDDDDDDDFWM